MKNVSIPAIAEPQAVCHDSILGLTAPAVTVSGASIQNQGWEAVGYEDGHTSFDDIEDPLPFDLNAPVIEIGDDGSIACENRYL